LRNCPVPHCRFAESDNEPAFSQLLLTNGVEIYRLRPSNRDGFHLFRAAWQPDAQFSLSGINDVELTPLSPAAYRAGLRYSGL
jgi:hypothetical protein